MFIFGIENVKLKVVFMLGEVSRYLLAHKLKENDLQQEEERKWQ